MNSLTDDGAASIPLVCKFLLTVVISSSANSGLCFISACSNRSNSFFISFCTCYKKIANALSYIACLVNSCDSNNDTKF